MERKPGKYSLPRREVEATAYSPRWRDELNEQQYAAVTAPDGPVLVLAGAGSGKTRVITYRAAFLIAERGVRPGQIMLATFTNKAARNMLARVEDVVGAAAREITGGTFHHIANLLLRRYGKLLGYDPGFTILDETDSRQVMKLSRGESGIDTTEKAFPSDRLLVNLASSMVNSNLDLETLLARSYPQLMDVFSPIQKVLIDFHQRKQASNQMDFDDLLVNLYRLLAEHPQAREELASRYKHVLVDEYQDVNHLQAAIVKSLFLGRVTLSDEHAAYVAKRREWEARIEYELRRRESLLLEDMLAFEHDEDLEQGESSPDRSDDPVNDRQGSSVKSYVKRDGTRVRAHIRRPHKVRDRLGVDQPTDDIDQSLEPDLAPPIFDDLPPIEAYEDEPIDLEDIIAHVGPPPERPSPQMELSIQSRGLFVVGDDAQSIYSFRGADYENIRSFPYAFEGATVCKLEVNYRSTPEILNLANAVLHEGDPLFRKELRPVRPSISLKPMLLACRDGHEQAEFVGEQLLKLREEEDLEWKQLAVLYRAHSNRLETELELTKRGIPFVVRGGLRFFEQAHIKDLVSYLILLSNARDELAWNRVLLMTQRVGPRTVALVLTRLRRLEPQQSPLGKFINNGVIDEVKGQAKPQLRSLQDFLRLLSAESDKGTPPTDLIGMIVEGRYKEYMELNYDNWRQRLDDIEQLQLYASRFNTLPALLAEVGLASGYSGADIGGSNEYDREEGAVTLSTVHQAKGLEWRGVIVISVSDDVIPHRMSLADPMGEDEERRLLYVAVTRAEEILFLSYPVMTETRDFQRLVNRPSRFISSLPKDVYDEAVLEWD